MAEKRCISQLVIDTDAFYDLSQTEQLLYFHLAINTDDWGVISSPKKLMRLIGVSNDDLEALVSAGFVIRLESGAAVITHFNVHNTLRRERMRLTEYCEELERLTVDEAGVYRQCGDGELSVVCQTFGSNLSDKVPLKRSENKRCEEKAREVKKRKVSDDADAPPRSVYGEYGNVYLSDEELGKLKEELGRDCERYIEKLSTQIMCRGDKYNSHLATLRKWFREDKEAGQLRQTKRTDTARENTSRDTRSIMEVLKGEQDK